MTVMCMSTDAAQDAGPISFVRMPLDRSSTWQRHETFVFVNLLAQIIISDSEMLQVSHHLPIAIDCANDRLQVVAITAPRFQHTPLVDSKGEWRRGYAPIAIRCHPFRLASDNGSESLEIAVDTETRSGAQMAVLAPDGTVTPAIRQIVGLLRRLAAGQRRLQAAAERLLIADVLAPFQMIRTPGAGSVRSRTLTVDRNRFAALSNRRAAHIAKDDFLAMDLAAACLFSQRLIPGPISVVTEPELATEKQAFAASDGAILGGPGTELDDSELFSFALLTERNERNDKSG